MLYHKGVSESNLEDWHVSRPLQGTARAGLRAQQASAVADSMVCG